MQATLARVAALIVDQLEAAFARVWTLDPTGQVLELQASAGLVRIWIEDNGIGIPKQAHEKIFGMFQHLHRDDQYPGIGIGLALVRKALERMNGRIGLESEPGRRTRFWIELPRAAAPSLARDLQNAA